MPTLPDNPRPSRHRLDPCRGRRRPARPDRRSSRPSTNGSGRQTIRGSSSTCAIAGETLRAAAALPPLRPRESPALGEYPSRSRTISKKTRIRPAALTCGCPDFRHMPETTATAVARLEAVRRDPRRQDQSRPVRDRTRRCAHPLSRPPQRLRRRDRPRRIEFRGVGRRGRTRPWSRSPSAPTRPDRGACLPPRSNNLVGFEAEPGPRAQHGRLPGLSISRLRLDLCPDGRRCRRGPGRHGRVGRGGRAGPAPFQAPALAELPPGCTVGIPDRGQPRLRGATRSPEQGVRRRCPGPRGAWAFAIMPLDLSPFSRGGTASLRGPLGRRAVSRDAGRHGASTRDPAPGDPADRGAGRRVYGDRYLRRPLSARGHWRRSTGAAWRQVDALMVPSIPRSRTLADLAARSGRPEQRARRLHEFRQSARSRGDRRARAFPEGRPAGRRDGHRAGRRGQKTAWQPWRDRVHRAAGVPAGATGTPPASRRGAVGPCRRRGSRAGGRRGASVGSAAQRRAAGRRWPIPADGRHGTAYRLFALAGKPPRPGLLRTFRADAGMPIENGGLGAATGRVSAG